MEVGAEAAQQLALALHELATNAMKFGALGAPGGGVSVEWRDRGRRSVAGAEALPGARPRPRARELSKRDPSSGGFGTILLMRAVPAMLKGVARRTSEAAGLWYELKAPLSAISAKRRDAAEEAGQASDLTEAIWSSA